MNEYFSLATTFYAVGTGGTSHAVARSNVLLPRHLSCRLELTSPGEARLAIKGDGAWFVRQVQLGRYLCCAMSLE